MNIQSMLGLPVVMSDMFADGTVIFDGVRNRRIIIGTRPPTPVEQAREDARRIVQTGLADVLQWLGQPPYQRPLTHHELLGRL
jgi:hypothetical protein